MLAGPFEHGREFRVHPELVGFFLRPPHGVGGSLVRLFIGFVKHRCVRVPRNLPPVPPGNALLTAVA